MGPAAKPTRENRTITVDFRDDATYFQLLKDGKAFVECVLAFLLALGFQLKHKEGSRQPRVKMHSKAEPQSLQTHTGRKYSVFHIQLRHPARMMGH